MNDQSLSPAPADAEALRLAALGAMAGKLAHDFRNQLAVILGNAELLADTVEGDPTAVRMLQLIRTAGAKAQAMTEEVLAITAASEVPGGATPSALAIAQGLEDKLQPALGVPVRLAFACAPDHLARLDTRQVEAALTLLATVARPALPKGGRISLAITPAA